MRRSIRTWTIRLIWAAAAWPLLQAGCVRGLQREMEVLFALEGSMNLVRQSVLVDWLGPQFLKFWVNPWWAA